MSNRESGLNLLYYLFLIVLIFPPLVFLSFNGGMRGLKSEHFALFSVVILAPSFYFFKIQKKLENTEPDSQEFLSPWDWFFSIITIIEGIVFIFIGQDLVRRTMTSIGKNFMQNDVIAISILLAGFIFLLYPILSIMELSNRKTIDADSDINDT